MAALINRGIPLSSVAPKYLHTNSTSHTWPFSAIAELIDNSYDPDVNAKQIWIDKSEIKDQDCLIFMDNGKGMDNDKLHKMLSFGYSDKKSLKDHVPVGLYGNGFKSGSMRLGKDAIVFSKKAKTMCVGLLSQTYLEKTGAQNVIVPIVMFTKTGDTAKDAESLNDILKYSLFNTKEELLTEFSVIEQMCTSSSGTRIIIWNLRRTSTGQLELDFKKEPYDFQIPIDVLENSLETNKHQPEDRTCMAESEYSLRAYCSILYLKPKMHIILQGKKVKTLFVKKTLAMSLIDSYKPDCVPPLENPVPITFGYNAKNKQHYGLMLYHKNRLIKAYERVPCQRKAKIIGAGIIGVMECDYLKPTHNKQDFENTEIYRKTMLNVSRKLEEYWKEVHHRYKTNTNCTKPLEKTQMEPDQNWVNCESCLKWRKLPDGINNKYLPDKWFCKMNPDPKFRTCEAEEESDDSDDELMKYKKTYKQSEKNDKIQEEERQNTEQQIRLGSSPSNDNLVDTQDTHATSASKGNKRAQKENPKNPAKKKAKAHMPDSSSVFTNPAEGSSSTTNQHTHASYEVCQNCNAPLLQTTDKMKELQDKVAVLKKEKSFLLSVCKSLEKDLEALERETGKDTGRRSMNPDRFSCFLQFQ